MQTIDLVKKIVEALEDKKAEDITVLDIGEVSSIADYFIIANGNNANQLTAMEDAVDEAMYTNGVHQKQVEGTGNSTWILMDYQDIIVHLFSKEDRQFPKTHNRLMGMFLVYTDPIPVAFLAL